MRKPRHNVPTNVKFRTDSLAFLNQWKSPLPVLTGTDYSHPFPFVVTETGIRLKIRWKTEWKPIITARKRSLCYVFTPVCQPFCSQGRGLPQCMLGYTPPGADTPWSRYPQSRHPLGADTHPGADTPLHSACWEIRATSRWYASYWNAYLFILTLH